MPTPQVMMPRFTRPGSAEAATVGRHSLLTDKDRTGTVSVKKTRKFRKERTHGSVRDTRESFRRHPARAWSQRPAERTATADRRQTLVAAVPDRIVAPARDPSASAAGSAPVLTNAPFGTLPARETCERYRAG